jgi:thiosulfate reductase/polysulfide reductase chain A
VLIGRSASRIKGPTGEYYKPSSAAPRTSCATSPRASRPTPGDNGVKEFRDLGQGRASGTRSPTIFRQVRGEFFEWDGKGYNIADEAGRGQGQGPAQDRLGQVRVQVSSYMEHKKDWILAKNTGAVRPRSTTSRTGKSPSTPAAATCTSSRRRPRCTPRAAPPIIPHAILHVPAHGGRQDPGRWPRSIPAWPSAKGIRRRRPASRSSPRQGEIFAIARVTELTRPDVHRPALRARTLGTWGRWAKERGAHVDEILVVQQSDRISGMANYYSAKASIEKA